MRLSSVVILALISISFLAGFTHEIAKAKPRQELIHGPTPSIVVASGDYSMSTEDVVLFDLDQSGGTITLPPCSDGRETVLSPKDSSGEGVGEWYAQPAGSDAFDPSVGSSPIGLSQWSKWSAICYQGVWYQH